MKRRYIGPPAILGLAAFLFGSSPALAQISLGSAQSFAVLGGSTVSNVGATAITGDVGVFPGSSVTGFPPGTVSGVIHAGNAVAAQAQTDLTTAYNAAAAMACSVDLTGQNLGGLTLTPAVYCFSSSASLAGTLTLDFQGNPNALFVFKTGGALTTTATSSVILINNGGNACPPNLYWQVGSSANLGPASAFVGNILALNGITLNTGASLNGRALARTGAVTLDTSTVQACAPAPTCPAITVNPATLPNGTVGTAYNATVTASGGVGPYTFAVTSGALPAGLVLNGGTGAMTGTPTAAGTFNFTIKATDTSSGCLGGRAYTVLIAAAAPQITSFTANPSSITPGDSSTLSWTTLDATSLFIDNGIGTQPVNGSISVSPAVTTTYTLTAMGPGGSTSASVTVTVNPLLPPVIDSFTADKASINPSEAVTLRWATSNATAVNISEGVGSVPLSGSFTLFPNATTTYVLTATGPGGSATAQVTVTVSTAIRITNFQASPARIAAGDSSTLLFSTEGATSVTIDGGVGAVPARGTVVVRPTATTTYTLTAIGPGGVLTATTVVEVVTVPAVLVSSFPAGLLQNAETGGAVDRYVLANVGGASTTITLSQSGTFFTQGPSSFTLAPGASQVVSIVGVASAAGAYEGTSLPAGSGVPSGLSIRVRLLSAAPPAGTLLPVPSTNRVDTTAPAGSVDFRNDGTVTLQGILVSDVPWIVPQSGVITIPSGGTVTVTFTIDRTKRPDRDAPAGSVNGSISLVYYAPPAGTGVVAGIRAFDSTPVSTTRPVIVVDTAVPVTRAAGIPPLLPGEVALVVPGLGKSPGTVGDLALVNSGSSAPLTGIQLFYTPSGSAGSSAQNAGVTTLTPNLPVSFGNITQSVFNSSATSGSLQLRSRDLGKISASANIFSTASPAGLYGGTLAAFRSDRSAGIGERVFLTGVRSDSRTRSDLYLQETAGAIGLAKSEFFSATGALVGSRVDTMSPFGVIELRDIVPAAATSAVVTNMSIGPSRLVAHVLVVDLPTGDITDIVDWNRRNATSSAEAQLVPLAVTGTVPVRTEMSIMNTGGGSASVTLSLHTQASARRRSVRRGGSGVNGRVLDSMATSSQTLTFDPGQTRVLDDVVSSIFSGSKTTSGYVILTPSLGSFAVTSRAYTSSVTGPANFGTAVPAIALSSGLQKGESRKIAGLEDSAPGSVASFKPGTFRTGLGLIESAGKPVKVRVTLRYAAAVPGGLAEVRATATKEYDLAARQIKTFSEIGREMFGAGRDNLGDLHNLQLDIEVLSGDGAVIPFTVSTENGSGDSFMRTE